MVVHTLLSICSSQDKEIRRFKTTALTGTTHMQTVVDFILKKYKKLFPPFDIRIFDQSDGLVTLDQDYLDEYNPFLDENFNLTTTQSVNPLELRVQLRVFLSG